MPIHGSVDAYALAERLVWGIDWPHKVCPTITNDDAVLVLSVC